MGVVKTTKEAVGDVVVDDWRTQLKSYSFWLTVSSVVLTVVTIILPYMGFLQPILSTQSYGISMFALNALAAGAKFIKQKSMGDVSPNNTG